MYQYLKENKKAESALLNGNKLLPNNFDFIYALSDYYFKQKDYTRALQYATELKTKFPSKPEGQMMINYINEQLSSN